MSAGETPHYHDSEVYQDRDNLRKQNANLFLSNNSNPFLISPYNFPSLAAYAKTNVVEDISSIISTIIADLTAVIDLNTYTLTISTISPISAILDPSQRVHMTGDILQLDGLVNLNLSTLQSMTLTSVSTIAIAAPLTTVRQVLAVSTLSTTNVIVSTLQVNTGAISTFFANTLVASTASTANLYTSSIQGNNGI
jgi:hypothetical protein